MLLQSDFCVPQNRGRPEAPAAGLRVLMTVTYVSKRVAASRSGCLGRADNHKAAHLLASGFPAFAGPSPDFVVFPGTGWNCSLAEKETELRRALPKASISKGVNLMNNSFTHFTSIS